jgi:hypothetical protein
MEQATTKVRWEDLSEAGGNHDSGGNRLASAQNAGAEAGARSYSACHSRILTAAAYLLLIDGVNIGSRSLSLVLVFAACSVPLVLGLPHTSMYGHDLFILLDGGWRVLEGQRPHVNFYSAFGPVTYLIAAAGLWLGKLRVEGILYATVAVGVVLGVWATAIASVRMKAWSAVLFTSFTVLFWLAPFPLGEPYYLPSYAMQYNRLGYALLSIALVELFVPASLLPQTRRFSDWGGLSSGAVLALLLFLKISFFAVGFVLVAAAFALFRRSWRNTLFLIAGFLLVCLVLLSYLHWDIPAIWTDWRTAAHARTTRFHSSGDPFRTIFRNLVEITTLASLAVLAMLFDLPRRAGREVWTDGRLTSFVILLLSADLLLAIGNTQRSGFPLSLVAALILANSICSRYADVPQYSRDLYLHGSIVVFLVGVLALLPYMTDTINGWGVVLMRNVARHSTVPNVRLDASPLRELKLDDHDDPAADLGANNGALLVNDVNEGLSLIRSHSDHKESVTCLCFSNPFSFALLRKPAEGGSTFFAYGTNFTSQFTPSASRILGDAELVIYPNQSVGDDRIEALLRICRADLAKHYRPIARSEHWILLKKIQ